MQDEELMTQIFPEFVLLRAGNSHYKSERQLNYQTS